MIHRISPGRPRRLVVFGMLLAAAASGCGKAPGANATPTPLDRIMQENRRASEAVVYAARDLAKKASDAAEEIADAAKEAVEALRRATASPAGTRKAPMNGK